jgi:hypothetical protein
LALRFFLDEDATTQTGRIASLLLVSSITLLLVGVPIGSIIIRWHLGRKWETFAAELGLRVKRPNCFASPIIQGLFCGYQITVRIASYRISRGQDNFTDFVFILNEPNPQTFEVQRTSPLNRNREPTGYTEIDKNLAIKASSISLRRQLLANTLLRQGLLELGEHARSKELILSEETLQYSEQGQISDIKYMRAVLLYLVDLSNLVERFNQMDFQPNVH